MEDWERRLAHDKRVRDAYVAMGNPAPTQPDPPGGMMVVQPRRFDGRIFWDHIAPHDSIVYAQCSCRYSNRGG